MNIAIYIKVSCFHPSCCVRYPEPVRSPPHCNAMHCRAWGRRTTWSSCKTPNSLWSYKHIIGQIFEDLKGIVMEIWSLKGVYCQRILLDIIYSVKIGQTGCFVWQTVTDHCGYHSHKLTSVGREEGVCLCLSDQPPPALISDTLVTGLA